MGYRSDVSIRCERWIAKKIYSVIEDYQLTPSSIMYCTRDDSYTFHWEWIKWYPEFEEIRRIERILDESEGAYKFVRTGEDQSDIEERASEDGWDYPLYVVIYIENDEHELFHVDKIEDAEGI